jgi:hypothetical protein
VRRIPAWGLLGALVLVSTVVRAWAGLRVQTPWIAADEMIYAELGRSLWESGRLEILGADTPFYSLVHPALIGLPLALFDTELGYDVARVLQALAMSLTAVPVFLWGRRLMSEGWALVAAALTLTLPAFAYSGLLMTETVFLPVMTLAAWSFAAALERPTPRNQAFVLLTTALAVLTRLQALVLVPVFLLALALYAVTERSTAPLRRTAYAAGGLLVLGLVWLLTGGFGAYAPAGETTYDVGDALRFAFYHVGDALLLVGLAPACALALVALSDLRGGVSAYLAVTFALFVGLVAEVGLFASRYVGRLAERDLLPLAPLLFLGLSLWLDRGAPRTRVRASVVALIAAALVVLLPYGRLVHKGAIQDAFMLLPLWELGSYDALVGVAAAVVVLLFVLYPHALPIVLAALFLAVSVDASRFVEGEADSLRGSFFGADPAWVDAAVADDVAYFYDGEPHWNAVWGYVFWNRHIREVITLDGARVPGPVRQRRVPLGQPLRAESPFVLASTAFTFFGEPVAGVDQQGLVQKGLILWRLDEGRGLSTVLTGVQGSGDIYGPAKLVAYDCTGGRFEVTLVAKGAPVTVDYRAAELGRIELAPEQVVNATIPAAPSDGVCTLDLEPTGLVGSTRFAFVRG